MHYNDQFRICERIRRKLVGLSFKDNTYMQNTAVKESLQELTEVVRCIIDELERKGRDE